MPFLVGKGEGHCYGNYKVIMALIKKERVENVLSLESSLDFGNGLTLSYHLTKMTLAKPMNLLQAT